MKNLSFDQSREEVKKNYSVCKEKERKFFEKYGANKFLLIKNGQVLECFETKFDALKAGKLHCSDGLFSVQNTTNRIEHLGVYSCH